MIYPVAVIVDRRRRRRRHSVEGHPDVRGAVRRPRRRAAAADARRHRAQRQPGRATVPFIVVGVGAIGYALQARTTRPTTAAASIDAHHAEGCRCSACIMRKIAVARFCRTLSTLHQLGRADPRRPRDHREDRRATPSSRTRSWRRARASSAARRSRRRCKETNVFPVDGRRR